LNGAKVDEDIRAAFSFDEAVAFGTVEPFDRADNTFCLLSKKRKNSGEVCLPSDGLRKNGPKVLL